ncbi:peptidoglycan DD-metalloendopeptidase family protein [Paenibacillus sp. LHD-38]|uniref:peptidoglycan DD-metalloendopeptidase family protein n=1 Tax=Paenibacillus sp. LHD-38 TaxID=3072143 RepID=UPI00280C9E11|nr:peptidoglycan DD-metalloendopeptidase family protein [Paenibacillus sp. LHD-38]MDQ8733031.1 peptidoglycan DD-metalloendopeptidase family protein [Paenibacillus sp. LHD-38]
MKRARKPKWSFVVLRGADKTVKQFHVSKRSVFAAPTAVVLAVSGCITGLQLNSHYEKNHLEEKLSEHDLLFSETLSGKDETIHSLQQELVGLSEQANEMKKKMEALQQLESHLKQFINNYGDRLDSSTYQVQTPNTIPSAQSKSLQQNASNQSYNYIMESKPLSLLVHKTGLTLTSLNAIADTMEKSMALTLELAQTTRISVDAYPSVWPTRSKLLSSGFGYRRDPLTGRAAFHAGIDITGKLGDPVFSAADGTVSETGYNSSLGAYIVIDHLAGLQSAYMHLKEIETKEGDFVVRGEKIGLLGSSGRSTGPHLHFQIMHKDEPVNPIPYLSLIKED